MKLAIFDFDGTLLNNDTLPSLAKSWYQQQRSRTTYYRVLTYVMPIIIGYRMHLVSQLTMKQQTMERFVHIFKGMHRSEIQEFFHESYDYLAGFFNPLVLDELERVKQAGFKTVLLSGAYQDLLDIVAEKIGIELVIGSEIPFDQAGVIDLGNKVPGVLGENKFQMLTRYFNSSEIDWADTYSYADSFTDLSILEPAGFPVMVNPDDNLRTYGVKRGWRLLEDKVI